MGEVMYNENQVYRDVNYNDYALNYQSYMESPLPTMQMTNSCYTQYSVKNLLNLVDDAQRKEEMKCPSFDLPAITDQCFPASLHQPLSVGMKQNFGSQWPSFVADESAKTIPNIPKEISPGFTGASLGKSIDIWFIDVLKYSTKATNNHT